MTPSITPEPEMTTDGPGPAEPAQAVRELEEEIGRRLAAARATRATIEGATADAAELRDRATVRAEHLARELQRAIASDTEQRAQLLRSAGERRATRVTEAAARSRSADVGVVLAAVLPAPAPEAAPSAPTPVVHRHGQQV